MYMMCLKHRRRKSIRFLDDFSFFSYDVVFIVCACRSRKGSKNNAEHSPAAATIRHTLVIHTPLSLLLPHTHIHTSHIHHKYISHTHIITHTRIVYYPPGQIHPTTKTKQSNRKDRNIHKSLFIQNNHKVND